MRKTQFLLLFLFLFNLTNAQNWSFKIYNQSNSTLFSDVVNSLLLDKNNQLWFGTNNGLGKFTSNQFTKETYRFSEILNLWATGDTIWIGTKMQGLWKLYNNQYTSYDATSIGNGIIGFAKGKNNTLFRLDKFGKFTKLVGSSWVEVVHYIDHAAFLFCDSHQNIWVGSGNVGLYKYNNETLYYYKNNIEPTSPNYIPASTLNCMIEDTEGNLWVGTSDKGLLRYYQNQWFIVPTPSDAKVFDIDKDKNNKLWLVTDKGIMTYYQNEWTQFNTSNSPLPGNWFDDILVENENKIWIATGYCGLICLTNTPTGIIAPEKINCTIYPNPTQHSIHIDFHPASLNNVNVSITNSVGQTLYSNFYKSITTPLHLDLSNYPSGLYFINLRAGNTIIKNEIIKKE